MKKINQIPLSKIISTGTRKTGDTTSKSREIEIVNDVVKRLKKMRTGWRAGFKSETDVNGWKEELLIACIENEVNCSKMINKGLARARRDDKPFFPSVGEFIKWCLGDEEHHEHKRLRIEQARFEENQKTRRLTDMGKKERTRKAGRSAIDAMKSSLTE